MKISYDPEIDALYIRLLEGKHECRCVRLSDEVALNLGPDEKLVGIEILEAREVLGFGKTPAVLLEAGVIVNRDEELKVQSEETRKGIAAAVAQGVERCLTRF